MDSESKHVFYWRPPFIFEPMLFLAAIARFSAPPEPQSNDLLVQSRLGHLGLTVIALVYILVTLWQQQ